MKRISQVNLKRIDTDAGHGVAEASPQDPTAAV